MKKLFFWSAIAMLTIVSCNKDIDSTLGQDRELSTFTATVDSDDTRTVLDGTKSYWSGEERFWVLYGSDVSSGSNKKAYVAQVENKSETASFTEEDPTYPLSGGSYMAVYPAANADDATWEGAGNSVKNMWLDGNQTAVAGTYDTDAHISMAYTTEESGNLEFKNVVSLVKVTVGNDNVSEICFYGNNQEVIAGNFDVDYNDGNPIVSTEGTATSHSFAKITGTIEKDQTYYIAILPTTFENGFSVEFVIDGQKYTKKASAKYTVERNKIINLKEITFDVTQVTYTPVYLKPNSNWTQANARFTVNAFNDAGSVWVDMTETDTEGIYEARIPDTYLNIIFCRMNPAITDNNWDNKWNQTADLTLPTDENNCYIVADGTWDNGGGEWMTLEEAKVYEPETPEAFTPKDGYIYLTPNSNWTVDNARFAAYFFGNGDKWVSMTAVDGQPNLYEVEVPSGYTSVIFCRMNPSTTANNWNNKWNQTADLTVPTDDKVHYTVSVDSWDGSDNTNWSAF